MIASRLDLEREAIRGQALDVVELDTEQPAGAGILGALFGRQVEVGGRDETRAVSVATEGAAARATRWHREHALDRAVGRVAADAVSIPLGVPEVAGGVGAATVGLANARFGKGLKGAEA